jgi:hypothetical protein
MGVDAELVRVEQFGTSPRRPRVNVASVLADPDERLTTVLVRVQHGGRTPILVRVDPIRDLESVPADMPQLLDEPVLQRHL